MQSVDPGVSLSWRVVKYRRLITIAAAILAADQATKAWIASTLPVNTYGEAAGAIKVIPRLLYIVHVGNTGAAWSVLSGRSILLASLAAATLVAIYLGRNHLGLKSPRTQACFGLMCGGIAGNLIDRIARGHVVDFIDFHFGSYIYPTFNVADSAICCGVILYTAYSLMSPKSLV